MTQESKSRTGVNMYIYILYSIKAALMIFNTSCVADDCYDKLNEKNDSLRSVGFQTVVTNINIQSLEWTMKDNEYKFK